MNILHVTPRYYPHIGGVEYVVKSVAERLARRGHNVTVLAGESGIESPRREEVNGVEVWRWPTWAPGGAYHIPKRRGELRRLLRDLTRDVDVVHIHSVHSVFSMWSAIKVRELGFGGLLVVTPHYHGTGHTLLRRALWAVWRPFVRKALAKADVVHVVSPVEAERILAHYPVEDKIVVVPNGVDEEVFQYKWAGQSSDYAIYAGRVERYKRLEEAAELVRRLGLWLVVVGKGPYRKRLEGRLRGVKFRDPLPRGEYLRTLAGARYAVNLSDMEAFSIFAAEALAMGVPVIASETVRKALRAEASQNLYGYPLLVKADVKTWDEVVEMYQSKLYGHITSRCSGASNSLNGLRDEDDSSKKIIF